MKRAWAVVAPGIFLLYSLSFAYLGITVPEMKKKMGEPVKKEDSTYLFETKAKASNKVLKIDAGEVIKVEAVVKDDAIVRETVYPPKKLDTQKDVLNWIWTYTGGKIRDINHPKTKAIAELGGQKAYYFTGGYWAIPQTDPNDGTVTSIIVGKE